MLSGFPFYIQRLLVTTHVQLFAASFLALACHTTHLTYILTDLTKYLMDRLLTRHTRLLLTDRITALTHPTDINCSYNTYLTNTELPYATIKLLSTDHSTQLSKTDLFIQMVLIYLFYSYLILTLIVNTPNSFLSAPCLL